MNFSQILKTGNPVPQGIEACARVNGKLSNAAICSDMLGDEVQSPDVCDQMVKYAQSIGFSAEDANTYWGYTAP